jgi:AcrR family transcriptional regulator
MDMSIPYEKGGRSNQKSRTRQALVDAARRLVAEGATPSVEDAAAAAAISRTTAYRYFPNQHALLAAAYPLIDMSSLLSSEGADGPGPRLEATVDALTRLVAEHEPELRTMFRLALDPGFAQRGELLLRQGRRIVWIEGALAPLRDELSAADFKQLVRAIGATVGIEAYAWLTDIAQLSPQDAIRTMRWSAGALLRAGIAESQKARP